MKPIGEFRDKLRELFAESDGPTAAAMRAATRPGR